MSRDFMVVIPARGGSKRVPGKNIRPLGGKPLMVHTIEAAIGAGLGDTTFVSTEDPQIAAIAREHGAQVYARPTVLADENASTESVLLDALEQAAGVGWLPSWVMTLPPTSPMRCAATVRIFVTIATKAQVDCVFSLTEIRADLWRQEPGGDLVRLFPNEPRRQQDRTPLYEENSAIYVTSAEALRRTGSILGNSRRGVVIDPIEGFDINTELDFTIASVLIGARERREIRTPQLLQPHSYITSKSN